jgi:hypothetical protein
VRGPYDGLDPELKLFRAKKQKGNFGNMKCKCSYPPQILHLLICFFIEAENDILNDFQFYYVSAENYILDDFQF